MGTWSSATPRGQFGAQAGGMIFTSSRHTSPRHWLGGEGFRKRDHAVPGTQPPLGHFGAHHKKGFVCPSPLSELVSPTSRAQPDLPPLLSPQLSTKATGTCH